MSWHKWRTRICLTFAATLLPLSGIPLAGNIAASAAGPSGTLIGGFDVGPSGSPEVFNPITDGAGYTWIMEYYRATAEVRRELSSPSRASLLRRGVSPPMA